MRAFKIKIYLLLLLLASSSLAAQQAPENPKQGCQTTLKQAETNGTELEDESVLANTPTYETLASKLCSFFNSDNLPTKSKNTILEQVREIEGLSAPNPEKPNETTLEEKQKIIGFLNANKDQMRCANSKHYLHRALEEKQHLDFFVKLFKAKKNLYTDDVRLDFSAITLTYNPAIQTEEPMTVLDYIVKVLKPKYAKGGPSESNGLYRQMAGLEKLLKNTFNAKSFADPDLELSAAERAKWKRCP